MIKFFRQIRQNLLSEGASAKYLKYAFGEIMLVVLGILIALSINNWNDDRKNKLTESDYYCKLLSDLDFDKRNITKLYEEAEDKIEVGRRTLLELAGGQRDKAYLINNYVQAYRANAFVPGKATITDILSTGKLSLLKNESLKNRLIQYYAEIDNNLYQLELNRTNILQKAFEYESESDFGFQNVAYAKEVLGPEILATLPDYDWHLDPNSSYYRQFRDDVVFFIIMSEREKQFLMPFNGDGTAV